MSKGLHVDIAFADPPYGFDNWPALLAAVTADFVVAESAAEVAAPDGWEQTRVKRYGRSWVTFLARRQTKGDLADRHAAEQHGRPDDHHSQRQRDREDAGIRRGRRRQAICGQRRSALLNVSAEALVIA